MGRYFDEQLEKGLAFQDWVSDVLDDRLHLPLTYLVSKRGQYSVGESRQGVEVKRDGKFRTSGNLYVELGERRADADAYVPSGIYRRDNSWMLAIGDEETLFLFSIRQLRILAEQEAYPIVTTPTSRGMLVPVEVARSWLAVHVIETEKSAC